VAADLDDPPVEAVLAASRTLVGIAVQSIAAVERRADLVEIRVLVVVAHHGTASLRDVAHGLGLHVSTASRLCDRMVTKGLLNRQEDPDDRRQLSLRLTARGRSVVSRVAAHRRERVGRILARMCPDEQNRLVAALEAFTDAAGEVAQQDLWAIGWTG